MANKTVLDFPEVTAPEDADVLYAIRGTSTGRDKRITWANLKQFLAPLAHAVTSTVYGVASSTLYGHVRLNAAPTDGSTDGVSSGGVYTAIDSATSALTTAIGNEASVRSSGDSGLQSQVNAAFAQITKLYGPTSSVEMGFDPESYNVIPATQSIDGRCMTVYASAEGYISLMLDPPASSTKIFYLRLKLPAYTAETLGYNQAMHIYFNSALDNNNQIMVRYAQQVAIGSAGVAQYSPIFTFVNNGANQWLMV